jgi:uncharacterized caspase-like protein
VSRAIDEENRTQAFFSGLALLEGLAKSPEVDFHYKEVTLEVILIHDSLVAAGGGPKKMLACDSRTQKQRNAFQRMQKFSLLLTVSAAVNQTRYNSGSAFDEQSYVTRHNFESQQMSATFGTAESVLKVTGVEPIGYRDVLLSSRTPLEVIL